MAKVGEILIAEGHLTQEGLEEALDWQVLYGGRIGTNLLELQLVEEQHLAHALGKQMGAEVAWGNIEVDPAMIGLIPKHIADRAEIVPWKMDKRRLKLLCCEIKVAEFDQLSQKLGRTCNPVVAPEFRIFQLLRAHYSALRQMRALDFGVVPEEGLEQRRRKKEKEKGNVVEKAPELIDEAAFNDIYAQVVAGRSAAPAQQWGTPPAYPPPPSLPPPQLQQPAPSWSSVPARPPPPMIAPVAPPAPAAVQPAPPPEERRTQPRAPPQQPAAWEMTPPQPQEQPIEKLPEDAILEELPLEAIVGEAEAEPPRRTVTW